jgi:hypothetical protein
MTLGLTQLAEDKTIRVSGSVFVIERFHGMCTSNNEPAWAAQPFMRVGHLPSATWHLVPHKAQ